MKAMKFIVSAFLLTISMGALAQDEATPATTGDEEISVETEKPFYHRVYGGFEGMTGDYSNTRTIADGTTFPIEKSILLKGFQVGYAWGINVSKKVPLAVELGAEFACGWGKTDYTYCTFGTLTDKVWACALSIPVNLTYKFKNVGGSDFTVMPFIGVRAEFNLAGEKYTTPTGIPGIHDGSLFKKEIDGGAMENKLHEGAWAQGGAQVGVNVVYKEHYTAGVYYSRILSPFVKHCNEKITNDNMFSVNVGYIF